MVTRELIVSVPDERLAERLEPAPPGVRYVVWPMRGPSPEPRLDLVVPPYTGLSRALEQLPGVEASVIQGQAIGYDGVERLLPPGVLYCNAAGVHEASTAELAVALALASLRGIPDFVRRQDRGDWQWLRYDSLADKTVLVIGQGGIGRAAAERFAPFEADLVRVATTARTDALGPVHAVDELPELLPHADVVVLAVPLTDATTHLVDDSFLSRMKDGALLVNVSRGRVVDTDALIDHASRGRIRAALDVMEPEPLPAGHPLWRTPGILITPHVGGNTTAMAPRVERLIRTQVERMLAGEEPVNVVLRT